MSLERIARRDIEIVGVATTPFRKPLAPPRLTDFRSGGRGTRRRGVVDRDIQRVLFSNAAAGVLSGQEIIRGQVALKGTGLEGVPLVNTENACASGSSAAHLAWLSVASGQADIVLAVGTETLVHKDKQRSFDAIESGTGLSLPPEPSTSGSVMMGAYAQEARSYARRHGVDMEKAHAALRVKNRAFAATNHHGQFRELTSAADVRSSRPVADPLRLLTCSPLTDGAAAVVFRAADGFDASSARPRVAVVASEMLSHEPGESVVARAATRVFQQTATAATDMDVFQLHDACAFAELQQYEHVAIAERGGAADAVLSGRTAGGGDAPVHTDGGLLSRGHPLGATGLAQIVELTSQLQGRATSRRVPDAQHRLAVNADGWMVDDYATAVVTLLPARTMPSGSASHVAPTARQL